MTNPWACPKASESFADKEAGQGMVTIPCPASFLLFSERGREMYVTDPAMDAKPLLSDGRCAQCLTPIIVTEASQAIVIKAAVLKADLQKHITFAKCPRCKSWLEVPLRYTAPPCSRGEKGGDA
jgi:hypothetical protein